MSVLPAIEKLLVSGGDDRIAIDPATGVNRYGCTALPDTDLLSFGSSTASVISTEGLAAAQRLYLQLQRALKTELATTIYAKELQRIRMELLTLCDLDDLPGIDVVLATSGTDLHLRATQLVSAGRPLLAIMVDAAETGRDVPTALTGQNFGILQTADAVRGVDAGIDAAAVVSIRLRQGDGIPRSAASIDAEVVDRANAAIAGGQHVLLVLADCTKTGLIAPSPACACLLKQRFPDKLDVMIDACQFRLAPATIRAYLAQDFMVALTGSKFMTGPAFSGALLIPPAYAGSWHGRALPRTLATCSTRAEWPSGWDVSHLPDIANFGLLLRWEAALAELRTCHALADGAVASFLESFAQTVNARLAREPLFEILPVPPLDRHPVSAGQEWDRLQTIFSFVLYHPAQQGKLQPLSIEETERVYRQLLTGSPETGGVRCQLGQPVACGKRNGIPVTALRLCASARLVVEALGQPEGGERVIDQALQVLDFVAALISPAS